MSQQAVETIRALYERWSEGDFGTGVHLYDPHVVLVLRPEFPDAGTYLGPEAVAGYMRGFLEPWTKMTIEAEEIVGAGDSVLVAVHQRAVGSNSGVSTELRYFHLWTFRGQLIRFESIRERAEALEAAGLPE